MSELQEIANRVQRLSELYYRVFGYYAGMLILGASIMGLLGIWVLYANARDKYMK
jgi:hypothetical protein